jgi:hypothetical protein
VCNLFPSRATRSKSAKNAQLVHSGVALSPSESAAGDESGASSSEAWRRGDRQRNRGC